MIDQNATIKFELNYAIAIDLIYERKPFYYWVFQKTRRIVTDQLDTPAAVFWDQSLACVILFFNPIALSSLSVEELTLVIEHEILHVVLAQSLSSQGGKESKKIESKLLHIACDYIISDNIPELVSQYDYYVNTQQGRETILGRGCLAPHLDAIPFFKKHAQKLSDFDAFTVYERLYNYRHPLCKFLEPLDYSGVLLESAEACLEALGEKADPNSRLKNKLIELNQVNQLDAQLIQELLRTAAMDCQHQVGDKGFGSLPGRVQTILESLIQSKRDYFPIIRSFVSSVMRDEKAKSWTRLNRRYGHRAPGKKSRPSQPSLAIVVDTSGSMGGDETFRLIAGEIKMLHSQCDSLWVIAGDTREQFRIKLHSSLFDVKQLQFNGHGGTDLQFGWDAARELGVDGVICHTDGMIPTLNTHQIKSLFMILEPGRPVAGHKNVSVFSNDSRRS